jgi:hypothetical protein
LELFLLPGFIFVQKARLCGAPVGSEIECSIVPLHSPFASAPLLLVSRIWAVYLLLPTSHSVRIDTSKFVKFRIQGTFVTTKTADLR